MNLLKKDYCRRAHYLGYLGKKNEVYTDNKSLYLFY